MPAKFTIILSCKTYRENDMHCDCSITPDCPAELYTERVIVARKDHTCCECNEVIKKGDKYERVKARWDGSWGTFSTCVPCTRIRQSYCRYGHEFGSLAEIIYECLGYDYLTGDYKCSKCWRSVSADETKCPYCGQED